MRPGLPPLPLPPWSMIRLPDFQFGLSFSQTSCRTQILKSLLKKTDVADAVADAVVAAVVVVPTAKSMDWRVSAVGNSNDKSEKGLQFFQHNAKKIKVKTKNLNKNMIGQVFTCGDR